MADSQTGKSQSNGRSELPDSGSVDKLKTILNFVAIVIAALVLTFFIKQAYSNRSKSNLSVDLGGRILEVKVDNNQIELSTLVDSLFATEASRTQTLALLSHYKKLYCLDDPLLVNSIETIGEKEFLSEKLRELLELLKGPFKRELHSFYNFKDEKAIREAVLRLDPDDPSAKVLKELLVLRKGAFQEVRTSVDLIVSNGDNVKEGFAAACRTNYLFRKHIILFDATEQRQIEVFVKNPLGVGCAESGGDKLNLIQISYPDMQKLVGDSPVADREPAYAVVKVD